MRVCELFGLKNAPKYMCILHSFELAYMCNINEISKNITKIGFLRKKCLQIASLYYIIVKRGMTYDDVGGYQSQEVTDLAVNFHGECPNREFGRHGHLI